MADLFRDSGADLDSMDYNHAAKVNTASSHVSTNVNGHTDSSPPLPSPSQAPPTLG